MSYRQWFVKNKKIEKDYTRSDKESQYVPIYCSYIIGEMLLVLLIIFMLVAYPYVFLKHKINPEKIRFLTVHLTIISTILIIYLIVLILSKKNKALEKFLVIFTIISNVALAVLFYFDIKLEMFKPNKSFEDTMYFVCGIHLFFNIYLIRQSLKSIKRKQQRNRARASDDVLFDEEENIKF